MDASIRWPVLGGIGVTVGLVATVNQVLLARSGIPLLITPIAASTTLLFVAPKDAATQPWSVIGGSTLSALVGVGTRILIHDPILASALCVMIALVAMSILRCLHPPGTAVAVAAVLGGDGVLRAGYGFAFLPVFLDAVLIVLSHRSIGVLAKIVSRQLTRMQDSQ